jgi:hypothetical protein
LKSLGRLIRAAANEDFITESVVLEPPIVEGRTQSDVVGVLKAPPQTEFLIEVAFMRGLILP